MRIAVLSIGDMGATVAAALQEAGHQIACLSAGRSQATRARADRLGLIELGDLAAVCACDAVVSVCPPHRALEVAASVFGAGFTGLYLDANAVSPATMEEIARHAGAATLVDGGIIGGATRQAGRTHLHLSGSTAQEALALFDGGFLVGHVVDDRVGSASALKMAYAAWTKGTIALLASVRALAVANGVESQLLAQWSSTNPDLAARSDAIGAIANRAWRWQGEMLQIAQTIEAAGLPGGFHEASAQIYDRLAPFKDAQGVVASHSLTEKLLGAGEITGPN